MLNLAAFSTRTQALGPGLRAVIWVQGCPLNCIGCISPDWIPFKPGIRFTPEEILEKFDLTAVSGLTFSGGEPMEQAHDLAMVARLARKKKDINIICFTGYRYERLLKDPPNAGVADLLAEIDLLIDGPFIQFRSESIGLRGSSNQRFVHLTNRLAAYNFATQTRKVEITVTNGQMEFIGIPTPAIKAAMDRASLTATERK
jgi:anaerobic ribonucleoside-triphosphate reductase activating protein